MSAITIPGDCECETPRVIRITEFGKTKTLGGLEANREYDIIECRSCGEIDYAEAATRICTIAVEPHGVSDCSPTSYRELYRKGNEYYIREATRHEEGTYVHGRETITSKEADEIIEESCRKDCYDCGRDLAGRRDHQVPYLCHICAGIRLEAMTC